MLYGFNKQSKYFEESIMSKTDVGKMLSCIGCEYKTKWTKDMTRHQEAVKYRKMYECKQFEYKTTWKGHLVGYARSVHICMQSF
jgi:hypothetical protein